MYSLYKTLNKRMAHPATTFYRTRYLLLPLHRQFHFFDYNESLLGCWWPMIAICNLLTLDNVIHLNR